MNKNSDKTDLSMTVTLETVRSRLETFVRERRWEQFHSPKNLVMAISGEVGELCEHFQWLTQDESKNLSEKEISRIGEEIADILIYLIMLSDNLNIHIFDAVDRKITKNEKRYPVRKAKGSRAKYTDL